MSTLAPGCRVGNGQQGYKYADGYPSASLLNHHKCALSLKGSQDRKSWLLASSAEEHATRPSTLGPCLAGLHLGPRKQVWMFLGFFSSVTHSHLFSQLVLVIIPGIRQETVARTPFTDHLCQVPCWMCDSYHITPHSSPMAWALLYPLLRKLRPRRHI